MTCRSSLAITAEWRLGSSPFRCIVKGREREKIRAAGCLPVAVFTDAREALPYTVRSECAGGGLGDD